MFSNTGVQTHTGVFYLEHRIAAVLSMPSPRSLFSFEKSLCNSFNILLLKN